MGLREAILNAKKIQEKQTEAYIARDGLTFFTCSEKQLKMWEFLGIKEGYCYDLGIYVIKTEKLL